MTRVNVHSGLAQGYKRLLLTSFLRTTLHHLEEQRHRGHFLRYSSLHAESVNMVAPLVTLCTKEPFSHFWCFQLSLQYVSWKTLLALDCPNSAGVKAGTAVWERKDIQNLLNRKRNNWSYQPMCELSSYPKPRQFNGTFLLCVEWCKHNQIQRIQQRLMGSLPLIFHRLNRSNI